MNELSALGVIIDRQRAAKAAEEGSPRPISVREVSRRTATFTPDGEPVHFNTIGRYQKGTRELPRADMLSALARVLATDDHPYEQLFTEMRQAANIPVGPHVGWNPPLEALQMTTWQREIVENTIKEFARANLRAPISGPATTPTDRTDDKN